MTMRITNQIVYTGQARSLQSSLAALATAQQRAISGSKLNVPSDDPSGAVTSLQLRAQQAQNAQYARNVTDGQAWTTAADTALQQSSTLVRNARDLVLQAGNGSLKMSPVGPGSSPVGETEQLPRHRGAAVDVAAHAQHRVVTGNRTDDRHEIGVVDRSGEQMGAPGRSAGDDEVA